MLIVMILETVECDDTLNKLTQLFSKDEGNNRFIDYVKLWSYMWKWCFNKNIIIFLKFIYIHPLYLLNKISGKGNDAIKKFLYFKSLYN